MDTTTHIIEIIERKFLKIDQTLYTGESGIKSFEQLTIWICQNVPPDMRNEIRSQIVDAIVEMLASNNFTIRYGDVIREDLNVDSTNRRILHGKYLDREEYGLITDGGHYKTHRDNNEPAVIHIDGTKEFYTEGNKS